MSSIPYWQRVEEQEYFNWTCVICSVLAKSPLHLQDQFLVEHGPYTDLDGEMVKSGSSAPNVSVPTMLNVCLHVLQ